MHSTLKIDHCCDSSETFQTMFWMGNNLEKIIEHVKFPTKGAKFGLVYVPTYDEAKIKSKNNYKALAKQFLIYTNYFKFETMPMMMSLGKESRDILKKFMCSWRMRSRHLASVMLKEGINFATRPPHRFSSPKLLGINHISFYLFWKISGSPKES